jgi:hypothetical protein
MALPFSIVKSLNEEEHMVREILKVFMIGTIGLCLFMFNLGCHAVFYDEHPTYRHEPPPPPREAGPPPWAPAHGYRAKHHYRYYPESYVYYDTGRSVYFYSEGGRWGASVSLPSSIHIDVEEYVSIEMDTDQPYRYHSEVVKKHPPGHHKKKWKGKGRDKWD